MSDKVQTGRAKLPSLFDIPIPSIPIHPLLTFALAFDASVLFVRLLYVRLQKWDTGR